MSVPSEISSAGAFVALQFGPRQLLLPQTELVILELLTSVRPSVTAGTIGELEFEGRVWPVYSLDDTLSLTVRSDPENYVCALLGVDDGRFGLTCQAVEIIDRERLRLQPVPVCMGDERQLIVALALDGERPLWLSSAVRLRRWLDQQEVFADVG